MMVSEARTRKFWSTPPPWHVVDSMSSPQATSAAALVSLDGIAALPVWFCADTVSHSTACARPQVKSQQRSMRVSFSMNASRWSSDESYTDPPMTRDLQAICSHQGDGCLQVSLCTDCI